MTYEEVATHGVAVADLVEDLSKGRIQRTAGAHLDPDLCADSLERKPGWRPMFGQVDAAQGHLEANGIGPGDLFLFFGWFRRVQRHCGRYRYVPGKPDLHILFGWLIVSEVWPLWRGECSAPEWAQGHPHYTSRWMGHRNTVYVAAGWDSPAAGGLFPRFREDLVLTAPGQSRSHWRLPAWFHPAGRRSTLSYHGNFTRWELCGDHVLLRTVGRGQEFVLNADDYPEVLPQVANLLPGTRLDAAPTGRGPLGSTPTAT